MAKHCVLSTYTEKDVLAYLLHEKQAKNRSLRDLAKEFKVTHGVIQRALEGTFPKRKDLRVKMKVAPAPRYPRIAIRLDNPESAADSIVKHMGTRERDELIELLMERCDTVV